MFHFRTPLRLANINTYPANPLPGENVHMSLERFVWDDPEQYRNCDFAWDFDDPGSLYDIGIGGQSNDRNYADGPYASHYYKTPGTYNPTLTIRDTRGNIVVATATVTVSDPANITWTKDIYVDFGEVSTSPDFTGWAPDSAPANIEHVTSQAQLEALDLSGVDDQFYRITWKDGETFTITPGASRIFTNSVLHFRRSGHLSTRPVLTMTNTANDPNEYGLTSMQGRYGRTVWQGVDADGGILPNQGWAPRGFPNLVGGNIKTDKAFNREENTFYFSISECEITGCKEGFTSNTGLANAPTGSGGYGPRWGWHRTALNNVKITNWDNYGVTWFGTYGAMALNGCTISQHPEALQGLDGGKIDPPQFPDHGCIRYSVALDGTIENCILSSANGWSAQGSLGFHIQPCIRLNTKIEVPWRYNISRNDGISSCFLRSPRVNNSNTIPNGPVAVLVRRNKMNINREMYGPNQLYMGGFIFQNNLLYMANVDNLLIGKPCFILLDSDFGGVGTRPNYKSRLPKIIAEFNTIISDRSVDSGGLGEFQLFRNEASGLTYRTEEQHNAIEVPNHDNAPASTGAFSRSDNFKPVTGNTIIGAVTTGFPVRDFDGNIRTNPTNKGCHHDSVPSASAPSNPVNNTAPTVELLANPPVLYPDTYRVNFGDWSNVDGQARYMVEFDWQFDGISMPVKMNGLVTQFLKQTGRVFTAHDQGTSDNIGGTDIRFSLSSADWNGGLQEVTLQYQAEGDNNWKDAATYNSDQTNTVFIGGTGTSLPEGAVPRRWRLYVKDDPAKFNSDITVSIEALGTLTCDVIYTNYSGNRVRGVCSNSIALT